MQWHPTLSKLLMVACEDDMSPVIQLWDLRSAAAMTPARELLGHNKVNPVIRHLAFEFNAVYTNSCTWLHTQGPQSIQTKDVKEALLWIRHQKMRIMSVCDHGSEWSCMPFSMYKHA